MGQEKEITERQGQCDIELGVKTLEELQSLSKVYRSREEEAYGPGLKTVLQDLRALTDQAVVKARNYLAENHTELEPRSPEGQLLRPNVPEWRPGQKMSSSND